MLQKIKSWARRIKRDAVTLWFAYRDPATPWLPKALCWFVVAYALSPIDLIPDFIPVLGFVDDALLLPGLIWLALRMLPAAVVTRSRAEAEAWLAQRHGQPASRAGLWLVMAAWLAGAVGLVYWWSGR
ncbi:hypothetical protein RD110_04755 [Rhodoferax koreense]|uniref:DUF1232 domain-containing protein n=1 Tax=Rhodoferax koreensis TaxID=1842727 RepID=A0A1P8JS91_9BURK|nr:YkvA family protein [Rhodoferax koreense]APW36601.1 hypothetical protein RD110_04755 [Rhodoferax koreense]